MAATVYIDAGHGGYDNGASFEGRLEKNDNLKLALAVGQILKDNGVDVHFTRTTDVYNSPYEKAMIANNGGADLLVSIHRNSSPTPDMYAGAQTLVFDDTGEKAQLARRINEELAKVGYNNLGVSERPNLTILRRSRMPAVLVEAGFINSEEDNILFDQRFEDTANAIARAILDTLQVEGQSIARIYAVQVGAFEDYSQAIHMANDLKNAGYDVRIGLL
ncbi:MAG: N-acetylmuramoyl-L-alanine amidase [Lachnospiraceae bacterium]